MSYKNRKGFLSINIQAGCESLLKFRFVSIVTAGLTHDNTAFLASEDRSLWENDKSVDRFGRPFWRSGDNAYSCTRNFINPWPSVNRGFVARQIGVSVVGRSVFTGCGFFCSRSVCFHGMYHPKYPRKIRSRQPITLSCTPSFSQKSKYLQKSQIYNPHYPPKIPSENKI